MTSGCSTTVQVVRGADARAPDGRLTVLVGSVRLEASIEDAASDEPSALV